MHACDVSILVLILVPCVRIPRDTEMRLQGSLFAARGSARLKGVRAGIAILSRLFHTFYEVVSDQPR